MIIRTINYDKDILDAAGGGPHFESFYKSNDTTFIEEALKYECPIRFLIYLENNKCKFTLVDNSDNINYQIDFSQRASQYTQSDLTDFILNGDWDGLVKATNTYDKYGKLKIQDKTTKDISMSQEDIIINTIKKLEYNREYR